MKSPVRGAGAFAPDVLVLDLPMAVTELREEALVMVYVGMDVHRKRTQVAIVDDRGEQLLNRNVANGSPELTEILASVGDGTPAAFEAGYSW